MKTNVFHFVCCFAILALVAGCQSTGGRNGANPAIQTSQDERSPQEVLADLLQKAGLGTTDLVLKTVITYPPPSDGDKNPRPTWQGCFAGREKAVLGADDRMLVIAETRPPAPRYVFNPFIRTWTLVSDQPNPEEHLLWVLFDGKARNFAKEVIKARDDHEMLSSLVRSSRPVTGNTFPVQISIDEMHNDLVELGLNALDEHLRTAHADGDVCRPEVRIYVRPAAGK